MFMSSQGEWTVSMGCGKKHLRGGCDVRMGILKCVVWCDSDNDCNKELARRQEPLIVTTSTSPSQRDDMAYAVRMIICMLLISVIKGLIIFDDVWDRLAYFPNLVTL